MTQTLTNDRYSLLRKGMILFAISFFLFFIAGRNVGAMTYVRAFVEASFTDTNGKKWNIYDFNTKSTILIYGRSSCVYSVKTLAQASSLKSRGKDTTVVFLGCDTLDSGFQSLKWKYSNVIYVKASSETYYCASSLLEACGVHSITGVPVIFVLDQFHHLAYYQIGHNDSALPDVLNYGNLTTPFYLNSSDYTIYISQPICPYTGEELTPTINVHLNKGYYRRLIQDRDYTVSYANNVSVGTAKIKITGINGFSGTITKEFQIVENGIEQGTEFELDKMTYRVTKGGKSGEIEVSCIRIDPSLKTVYIPVQITWNGHICKVVSLGKKAACKNTALQGVGLSNNLRSIGGYCFYGCKGLKSISLPSSLKSIGKKAFYNCSSLKNIWVVGSNLKSSSIGKMAFAKVCPESIVYVYPSELVEKIRKLFQSKGMPKTVQYKAY